MSEQQRNKMLGILVQHLVEFKKLSTSDVQWVIENPKEAIALILEAIRKRKEVVSNVLETEYLKLISGGETLVIDHCDGQRVLVDAIDWISHIDSDFCAWNADEVGHATPDTPVNVFELTNDGLFAGILGSLSTDNDKLCLTQDQIVSFVKKHRDWLRADGWGTFFVFKSYGNFFVARVSIRSAGTLFVNVYRLKADDRWYAEDRHRFVVPQLFA